MEGILLIIALKVLTSCCLNQTSCWRTFVELPLSVVALIAAVLELGAVSPISISVISSC